MRKTITLNECCHSLLGWHERVDRRLTPFGLLLLLLALFVPNIASAQEVTTSTNGNFETKTYGFNFSSSSDKSIVWSSETESSCTFFETVGGKSDYTRFATNGTNWNLTTKAGLYTAATGDRNFLVSNLYGGDVVTFNVSTNSSYGTNVALVSTNATKSNNTFTMSEKGSLVVTIPRNSFITSISIQHEKKEYWNYDPSIEIYDIYGVTTQTIQSNNMTPADFPLDDDGLTAQYLVNLQGGLALNNRVAIGQDEYNGSTLTPWLLTNERGLESQWSWHNLSICNLKEGDRVVLHIWGAAKFSSKGENAAYNGCGAFMDVENNGAFDEGDDTNVTCGLQLQINPDAYGGTYPYVITEDGHLDIALASGAVLTKVIIYSDHQANMVDKENRYDTNTSYFDITGQLEAKHHIVPGGLNVYVGNDNNTQHAEVVYTDRGLGSYVYDQSHFKMARTQTWGNVNVWSELPVTGTYYKFVPEVSGKMWVKFKAYNVKYRYYGQQGNVVYADQWGTPNEYTSDATCPYYFMVDNNGSPQQIDKHNYSNGALGWFGTPNGNPGNANDNGITVERGKTYYLYGWWQDGTSSNNLPAYACGVAELIEVTFLPDELVEPLAKWVESGTTSDGDLATVKGYTNVVVKKKSGNIASCEPYIEGGKLKIRNIVFNDANKGGGTILLKVGNPNYDSDPVFAYTIAYNAAYNPSEVGKGKDGQSVTRSEGHSWDFSTNPLKALKWNNKNAEADVVDFGTYFNNFLTADKDADGVPTNGKNNGSFLYEEIESKYNPDGTKHSDWTFNYRVKKNGKFMDPRFLNNYDMEGDNADMMWDTEGIIIKAGSTQSCIFNEYVGYNGHDANGVIDHNDNVNRKDPDRYVGFLPGGEFIIPKLKKDDRVIIYMGSGNGSGKEAMVFNISNARDAVYNEIIETDNYHAGGSTWQADEDLDERDHSDPNYRGCYHFFAKEDGDMVFKMVGGSMCKLYSIKIYRGLRENTVGLQENGNGYTVFANKAQDGTVTTGTNTWNLHYYGKGQTLADGTGRYSQNNEVLTHSGNITNFNVVKAGNYTISYTNQGEIGMLRVRAKDMEFNHNYVADFADRNFTLALHETQSYPYTWDFTDVNLFSGYGSTSNNDIKGEYDNYNEITDLTVDENGRYTSSNWYEPLGYELSMWDANGAMVLRTPEEYTNQNMIFENSKGIKGNQLYANGKVIPETQGLWFYFDSNDPTYNGSTQITSEGLRLSNTKRTVNGSSTMGWWNTKMVVPSVPSGAAVYARVKRDATVSKDDYSQKTGEDPVYFLMNKFRFDWMGQETGADGKKTDVKVEIEDGLNTDTYECRFYKVDDAATKTAYTESDDPNEYIIAILNKGEQSDLTLTLNGWIVEKLSISVDPKKTNARGWTTESRERVIDPELTAYLTGYPMVSYLVTGTNFNTKKITLVPVDVKSNVMPLALGDGDPEAYVIYNTTDVPVEILSYDANSQGFHLFVPDMHDYSSAANATTVKSVQGMGESLMRAKLTSGWVYMYETINEKSYTNYVLTYNIAKAGWTEGEDNWENSASELESSVGFYRVQPKGVTSIGHQGYLPVLTSQVRPDSSGNFFALDFDGSDLDTIDSISGGVNVDDSSYYNLQGQKLNGRPTQQGIYIVKGQKVYVK